LIIFIINNLNIKNNKKMQGETKEETKGETYQIETMQCSIQLNTTFTHTLSNIGFDYLPQDVVNNIMKDGRVFSHLIEKWISLEYPLEHIEGCQAYDFIDGNFPETKYDEKTFTKNGCKFCPSNMLGQGRVFDREIFEEKTKKLIFCIVSNVNFPIIKIRFVRGIELLQRYQNGIIPFREHDDFFT